MKIGIRYGKVEELLELPEDTVVAASPRTLETPPDGGDDLIRSALSSPIGTARLRDLACGKERVAIIVSDHTRPTPSWRIVPLLLEEIRSAGVSEERVTIVVATGTHDASSPEALEKMLGKELLSSIKVHVHSCDDNENLISLGTTSRGTPLRINRVVAEADLVVSVSIVEPHRLFGWSGGAKNIVPGVSARSTVNVHHGRYKTDPGGLDVIDGNAFRADAEEAARMAKLAFIINCALNEKREIVGAFAGDVVEAHRAAVTMGRQLNIVPIDRRVDLVVCGVGGPPRDQDFWQAQGKGLLPIQHALREGGIAILVAGCEMGMGTALFAELLKGSIDDIEGWSQEQGFSTAMDKAVCMIEYLKKRQLYMVAPGLSPLDFPRLPVQFFSTVQKAMEESARKLGGNPRILVAPDASRIVIAVKEH